MYQNSQLKILELSSSKISYYNLALNGGISHHELHLEYRWYEDGDTEFSEAANEVMFGYRYLMQRSAVEISVIENIFNMNNSTDVTFQ
nr:hypothetical protein A152_05005 [Vibrio tasmaniensis 1F-187]